MWTEIGHRRARHGTDSTEEITKTHVISTFLDFRLFEAFLWSQSKPSFASFR